MKIKVFSILLLLNLPLDAKQYYVSPAGSDSNLGTSSRPFRTIQRAADVVNPGDTVVVADGMYSNASESGTGSKLVRMTRGGRADEYVTFRSEHKWGAVLDGLNNTTAEGWTFTSTASYVRVEGFELKGFSDSGFSNWGGGHDLEIAGNNAHDIGRYCTDTANGRVGLFVHSGPMLIEQNVIHDIGRYSPGENGCALLRPYYQNQDHGIYIDRGNNITIRNNIFYNNRHGWSVHVYPNPVANLLILNNTFAFANPWRTGQILIAAAVTNVRIANNIFYEPNTAAIYFHPANPTVPGIGAVVIMNNLSTTNIIQLYGTKSGRAVTSIPGVTCSRNQEYTDPLLVSPSTSDFHLRNRSPAASVGLPLPEVANDYNGLTRAKPPSIGAYE